MRAITLPECGGWISLAIRCLIHVEAAYDVAFLPHYRERRVFCNSKSLGVDLHSARTDKFRRRSSGAAVPLTV